MRYPATEKLEIIRLLDPIGNIPPAEAEANYYAAENQLALAA